MPEVWIANEEMVARATAPWHAHGCANHPPKGVGKTNNFPKELPSTMN